MDGNLAARVYSDGEYSFVLADGSESTVVLPGAPDAFTLDQWTMTLEAWSASENPLETTKTEMGPYSLDTLVPWSQIPELERTAGVATYTTAFQLEEGWEQGIGAELSFEYVSDTMKIQVNGQELPGVDQISKKVDIGTYLVAGENTLTVEVTSNLANVKTDYVQEFGIVGSVTVTPYRQTTLEF